MALAANALVTLDRIKTILGISGGAEDDKIERIIDRVSTAIESYCGRQFGRTVGVVEKVPARGGVYIRVSRTPVESIASVKFEGTTIDASNYEIETAGAGKIRMLTGAWDTAVYRQGAVELARVGMERKLYEVTYTGGYKLPADVAPTLPFDIQEAAEIACVERYRGWPTGTGQSGNIASESLMSYSVDYFSPADLSPGDDGDARLPAQSRALLRAYRRIHVKG